MACILYLSVCVYYICVYICIYVAVEVQLGAGSTCAWKTEGARLSGGRGRACPLLPAGFAAVGERWVPCVPRGGSPLSAGPDPGCALGSAAGKVCRRVWCFAAGGESTTPFPKWLFLSVMEMDLAPEAAGSERALVFIVAVDK